MLSVYSVSGFSAQAVSYGAIQVQWTNPTVGSLLRLVRNSYGVPAHEEDGIVLLQQGIGAPTVTVTVAGHDNLLSAADASAEGSVGSWTAGAGTTVSVSTVAALNGGDSLQLQATTAGTLTAATTTYPIVGGASYVLMGAARPVSAVEQVAVTAKWSDGTTATAGYITELTGVYRTAPLVITAPAAAATVQLSAQVQTAAGPLTAPAAPTVTPAGTTGTTSYYYRLVAHNAYGTVTSAEGSTTTGNTALSSTNYNTVSYTPPDVPAGSQGNLVYDSNLSHAGYQTGSTWNVSTVTIGTANGNWTVNSPGTNAAAWAYIGTGSASGHPIVQSQIIDVTPGATYTLSGTIDATAATAGNPSIIGLYNPALSINYGNISSPPGVKTTTQTQITIPAGVTQVTVICDPNNATVTAGSQLLFSQIQLTPTSTVQPYAPGPLWTWDVWRGTAAGAENVLVASGLTGTSYNDTGGGTVGTIPTANTTGEAHLLDEIGVFPGDTLGYQLQTLSDGPSVYLPLTDGSGSTKAVNAVGSGDGTAQGAVTFGQPGVIVSDPSQTAAVLDGTSGYITTTAPGPSGNTFSVDGWANIAAGSPAGSRIVSTGTGTSGVEIYTAAGPAVTAAAGNGNTTATVTSPALTAGWHHIAVTYNGATLALYIDGAAAGTASLTGPVTAGPGPVTIGRSYNTGSYLAGSIAHVAVYPTALSAARVAAHYNAAKNTAGKIVQKWTPGQQQQTPLSTEAQYYLDNSPSPQSSGQFFYFTLWNQDSTGRWWRAADAQAVLPRDWGYLAMLKSWLPGWVFDLDSTLLGGSP